MIFISTNFLKPHEIGRIIYYVKNIEKKLSIPIGIEIFPFWDELNYENDIIDNLIELQKHYISFHDPYNTEHTAPYNSHEYIKTLNDFLKTISYGNILNAKHIVFHHNNCKVKNNKEVLIQESIKNMTYLNSICKNYNIPLLVENAGTIFDENMLFNQEEFEYYCKNQDYDVLIDLGHAFCNNWDIDKLIKNIGIRIKAYHIHNNYGKDSHNRIFDGNLDFNHILQLYHQYTPNADLIIEYSTESNCSIEEFCNDIEFLLSNL